MKKVIKAFKKLSSYDQNELYESYSEGELDRAVFPYNGKLEDGVLFNTEECTYLVPISSILEIKSSGDDDLDDDGLAAGEVDTDLDVAEDEIPDEE